jgi:hypothetical protein
MVVHVLVAHKGMYTNWKKIVRSYTHTSKNQPTPTNCAKKMQYKKVGNKPYKLFKQTLHIAPSFVHTRTKQLSKNSNSPHWTNNTW